MKKILSLVLILALSLCLFAGCGEEPATTAPVAGAGLEDAKAYLYAMYKEDDGTIARRDFSVVAAVMIDGVSYPIEWTTDAPDFVTIGAAENNMVKIDIVEEPAEQVTFKLIGTLKDEAGNTASVSITRIIEAKKVTGVEFVAAPAVDTAYKFAVQQNNLGQTLYFTGEMNGYYLGTSTNPFDAVDVFVENVEGGQRLYFMAGEVKTYIDVVPRGEDNPGKVNVKLTETPSCVFTWDAERKTFVTNTVADNTWYLGCYSTYNTISASLIKYIDNLEVIGASQFPAGLCTVNIVASQVAAPAVDTAYKFAVVQNNLGQTLYFTGAMNGYYLGTSVNPAEGVNVFVENVEGGQRLYFLKGETKVYIDVVPRGEDNPGKVNVVLTETPSCVFTWDAERKTFVTNTVADNTWYLGCYSTYNTISASLIKYIDNLEVIGATQFPAGPYIVEGFMDMQPDLDKHEHTPADAVVENEKAATCTENGSYDSVVYCSECKEEISRATKTVEATGHTAGEVVVENEVAATCTEAGSYDNATYCTVCQVEVSRETVAVEALGHTAGEVVVENEVAATCTEAGSYDNVTYCTVCQAEVSRETVAVEALGHTEGEPKQENVVGGGCGDAGSYDSVVYCTVCEAELSRTPVEIPATGDHNYLNETARVEPTCTEAGSVTMACSCGAEQTTEIPATGHTEGEVVVENNVDPTCTEAGSYDNAVYCTVCEAELSRETVAVEALGHTEGEVVVENNVDPTCTEAGSYDNVVYCSVCNEKLSTETTAVEVLAHTPGEAVKENEKAATAAEKGSYDNVVYCTVCNAEISRETIETSIELPENGVVAGVAYKISCYNANGTVWYAGTVGGASSGRFDITANEAEATLVYVEEVEGGYLIYSTDGTTKTYIVMNDKSAGGALTTNAAEATVFVWNTDLRTLVVADEENQRAFGCQNESTYANMSCYWSGNTDGYNWGQYIPVI